MNEASNETANWVFDRQYPAKLLSRMLDYDNERITFVSGKDKQRFSVHRIILTATSRYFNAKHGPNSQTRFDLNDTDSEIIRMVVDFCYSGGINLTTENIQEILEIASRLGLDLLEELCQQFLIVHLNASNCLDTLLVAERYRYSYLRKQTFDFICESFESIPLTEIHAFDPELLEEVLKSEKLKANADVIYNRLLEWHRKSESERNEHIHRLMNLIQLQHFPPQVMSGPIDLTLSPCNVSDTDKQPDRSFFCASIKIIKNNAEMRIDKFCISSNQLEEILGITFKSHIYFSVAAHRNTIYILGGETNGVIQKSVSSIDLRMKKTKRLPDMITSRTRFASIVFGKYIYVFGGFGDSSALSLCERFDTENEIWQAIRPMNVARYNAAASVFLGYICVAGGTINSGSSDNSVELYDHNSDRWIKLPNMHRSRAAFSLFEANGFLYAIGSNKMSERYDSRVDLWTAAGCFPGSELMANVIAVEDGHYGMAKDGRIGRLDAFCGTMSFIPLCKSKFATTSGGTHVLFRN